MNKPILLDGAIGTSLWAKSNNHNPVWTYNIDNPQIVYDLHREYIEAGSKILLANTFGANGPMVERAEKYNAHDVVSEAVRICKSAVADAKSDAKVCLSAGPLSCLMEPYGDVSEEEVANIYRKMLSAGCEQKPDMIMLQTFIDLDMMRVATTVAREFNIPVFTTLSFEKNGMTMFGNSVADVCNTLAPLGVSAIGMNCSLGPDLALPIIQEFTNYTDLPLVFKPNAGKPILSADGATETPYKAEDFVREVMPATDFVSYIGGCCGSDPSYITLLGKELAKK